MFKSEVMKEINLIILKKDLKKVTKTLYDLKLVEFFKLKTEKLEEFEPLDLKDSSKRLLKIRSTISFLNEFYTTNKNEIATEEILPEALELKEKIDKLQKEVVYLKDDVKREKVLDKLNVKANEVNNKNITIGFISAKKKGYLNRLKSAKCKFRSATFEDRIYFVANIEKEKIKFEFKEFYLPKEKAKNLDEKLETKQKELQQTKNKIVEFANNYLVNIKKQEKRLSRDLSIDEIRTQFTTSQNITILSAFITEKDIKKLKESLDNVLEDKFTLEVTNVLKDAPIKLNNSLYAKNFESLLKMYSLPKYGEFDPTTLMFLIFPIFFGFMLGDVIYGIISLIFFTIVKRMMPEIKEFLSVLQLSAVSSIIFGWIYGEFIGFEIHATQYGIGLLGRMQNIETLLIIAISFGFIHINMGLLIGFFNHIKNLKSAVTHYLSWIILQAGAIIAVLGSSVFANQTLLIAGVVIAIIGLILIIIGHGFVIGILELPGFVGNILSYARLMAVGISAVVIAELVNEFSHIFFGFGIFGMIAGIILFTGGHIFNIILGNFESFLHTLRLHYVEYFGKFYEGGGKEFVPFGTKVETEEE